MDFLDARTVIFSYAISNLICAILISILWSQNRKRFNGLGFWLADFLMQFAALVLIILRGSVPDFFSMTVSNSLVIGGTMLVYIGLEKFTNKRSSQLHNLILLAAFVAVHAYFVFIFPSLRIRNLIFSLGLLAICSQCAWLLLHRVESQKVAFTRGVGHVFVGFSVVSILRILLILMIPQDNDFFNSSFFETFVLITYQMLYIFFTFSLSLMVNRRLFFERETANVIQKSAEAALVESKERYRTMIENSLMGIALRQDERLVMVNQAFCDMIGYSKAELLNMSEEEEAIYIHPEDRQMIYQRHLDLAARKEIPTRSEYRYLHKNGQVVWVDVLAHDVFFGGRQSQIGMYLDTTVRRQAEEIMRLQLKLWEYGTAHSVNELMQMALDEIEDLTSSSIAFYHFVDEDQNTLSLRAWSTRTMAEFCVADANNTHYPIKEAGVWVDCVHQRKPVIHNDYASLPHRKGMPEGHAKVIRELVVPTIRNGRIVSILGIGNKPSDYIEKDIEMVSYIADIIWTIVEQKQTDAQIRQLNTQLEQYAMTDELTGLANRRSFFIKGPDEIKRAQRYHSSLSLMMMDIDVFKRINDSYGHEAGDFVLCCIANTLKSNIREVDTAARLGGEEFGILLPNTEAEHAVQLAERLRFKIEAEICSMNDHSMQITASIGVAEFKSHYNLDDLLRKADSAMYQAKREGGNRVILSS